MCTYQCGVKAFVKLLSHHSEVTGRLTFQSAVRITQLLTLWIISCRHKIFE